MLHSSSYLTVRSLLLQDTIMRSIVYAMRWKSWIQFY
jgi:hypothetical protein